jgi:hypothetical protein
MMATTKAPSTRQRRGDELLDQHSPSCVEVSMARKHEGHDARITREHNPEGQA